MAEDTTHPNAVGTDRLLLRPWLESDAERLLDIRSRESVARWLSDPEPWTSIGMALEAIESWAARTRAPDTFGVWAVVNTEPGSSGEPVGAVNLGLIPDTEQVGIGWYLHPDSNGRGFATEAAGALLDHARSWGVSSVLAIMWPTNHASARVAAAIGMTDLGIRNDPWYGSEAEPTSWMFRSDFDQTRGKPSQ